MIRRDGRVAMFWIQFHSPFSTVEIHAVIKSGSSNFSSADYEHSVAHLRTGTPSGKTPDSKGRTSAGAPSDNESQDTVY